jgi:hypothetical protein
VSRIVSRKAEYKAGRRVQQPAEIRYPGVFQIGLDQNCSSLYLVYRRQNNGGPSMRWMDLIYSRTGGVTILSEPSTSFLVTVDGAQLAAGVARVRLSLRHTGARPLRLDFPNSQIFDVRILDAKGAPVWLWSSVAQVSTAPQSIVVDGGERNWVVQTPLPDGRYFAEAWLEGKPAALLGPGRLRSESCEMIAAMISNTRRELLAGAAGGPHWRERKTLNILCVMVDDARMRWLRRTPHRSHAGARYARQTRHAIF